MAPDRFFVGLAVLGLLSEAAEERPLLCVVDDAQWLDRASAQALGLVARRLLAEPVAMVFATREPTEEFRGLPELVVHGLRHDEARELLASVIRGPLDDLVGERIVAETQGNPLALLELPQGLTSAELAAGFGLGGTLSLSGRIEESFQRRLEALPAETRRLLLVAAAEPVGDPVLVGRAATRIGASVEAGDPAAAAGLLEFGGRCGSAIRWCARRSTGRRRPATAGGCTTPWPRRPTQRSTPTGGHGTGRRRRRAQRTTSPPSWSARPAVHRRAAGWRRPRSWSGRQG